MIVCVVVAAAGLLSGCIGDGTHPVTSTLQNGTLTPGLWRTLRGWQCSYWYTLKNDPTGTNYYSDSQSEGPQLLEVTSAMATVTVHNCVPFWQEPGPFAKPLATPGQPFGPGTYQVGYEIAPGTYTATVPGPARCEWVRLKDFVSIYADAIEAGDAFGGTQTVTIRPTDRGFTSQHCGTWTKVG
jgi:hypothetical protein